MHEKGVRVCGGLSIGITGGIACGKSEVGKTANAMGIEVLEADDIARDELEPGRKAYEEAVSRFGKEILQADGTIDRKALGDRVFENRAELEALNRMVHPHVRIRWKTWLEERLREDRVAAVIIPLLFEVNAEDGWDVIICVASPETEVMERIKARGFTEEQARQRIAAQMNLEEKRKRSDYIIENKGSLRDLQADTEQLLSRILNK